MNRMRDYKIVKMFGKGINREKIIRNSMIKWNIKHEEYRMDLDIFCFSNQHEIPISSLNKLDRHIFQWIK
jgi:hypothetical protein